MLITLLSEYTEVMLLAQNDEFVFCGDRGVFLILRAKASAPKLAAH